MSRTSSRTRRLLAVPALIVTGVILAGCSSNQIDPDAVGLKYSSGSHEGRNFDKVVEPGSVEWTVNDFVVSLPTSQRSWIIRKDDDRADVKGVISVAASGGTLVDFEVSTAFKLNTYTNDLKDAAGKEIPGGTLRKFYEDICRHDKCNESDDHWMTVLLKKYHPQLESAFKDEARKYIGDDIVNNTEIEIAVPDPEDPDNRGKDKIVKIGTLTALQTSVGITFQKYLQRQTGSHFFCGPSFDRTRPWNPNGLTNAEKGCPPVEMLIISADYNNPEVRKAREGKKVAEDQASAQAALSAALKDPNYMEYLKIQAMRECAQANRAVCIFDAGRGGAAVSVGIPPN